jgi:hypothetical protein
VMVVKHQNRL